MTTSYSAVSNSKLVAWSIPNAAALAAILPTHGQEGLVARAADTGYYYELLAIDPTGAPTWSAAIGGGGGGGGPTVISANTTKNIGVAGDFTTFAAFLAFATSCIYSNGAVLTGNYLDATCTEQVVLSNVHLPIAFTSAGAVAVTPQAGWTATPLGIKAFMNFTNSSIAGWSGTWNLASGAGILNYQLNSTVNHNFSSSSWTATDVVDGYGWLNVTGGTNSSSTYGMFAQGGNINMKAASYTSANPVIVLPISGGVGATVNTSGCTFIATSAVYSIVSCTLVSSGNNLTASGTATFYNTNGPSTIRANADILTAAGNAKLAASSCALIELRSLTTTGIASTGARFSTNNGGIIQAGSLGSGTWGADSQALITPLATGLILSS